MIDYDFDLDFEDSDYPGLAIAGAFVELEIYLAKLSEVVPFARDQARIRFEAELDKKAHRISNADRKEKLDEAKWVSDDLIPRYFYGAFVVALAAAYESAVVRVADYVRQKMTARIKIDDLREPTLHKKLDLYLVTVMGEPLTVTDELSARINELTDVRNCLAHANGDLSRQNEKRVKVLEGLAKSSSGVRIRDHTLFIDESFARAYLQHAAHAMNVLLAQIHRKYSHDPNHHGN